MEFTTVGIVIRESLQGENDKLLTILTPEHGKITAYAKGVKKISSKNAPACQLFVYTEFELIKKNGHLTVKSATVKELFYDMRSDMTRYSLACYFAEILRHICMENNDESQTLRLFLNCLYALSYKKEIVLSLIKSAFELKLMCICGFMPELTVCFNCASTLALERTNIFSFEESGVLCPDCAKKATRDAVPYSCKASSEAIYAIQHICTSEQAKMLSFSLSDDGVRELSFISENYLIHKTERTFETLKIYKTIISSIGEK